MAKTEFVCNRCGYCCTDQSTQINLTLLDVKWLSDILSMSVSEMFKKEIITFIPFINADDLTKFDVEMGMKRPCPLYISGKCTVYEGRPLNCRIFPYWFITHKIEDDDLVCIKDVNPDTETGFRYRMYERMLGNILVSHGKETEEFMESIGATQRIDITDEPEVKKMVKLYFRYVNSDKKKYQKIAKKLMSLAQSKVDTEKLNKKIPLIEQEINKRDFEEKIETLLNADTLIDGEIMDVNISYQNT